MQQEGVPGWEHFQHIADIGVRGSGRNLAEAFEQAALAMTAISTAPMTTAATVRGSMMAGIVWK